LRWAWASAFNLNKSSSSQAVEFGCATLCQLSLHSLAQPRTWSGGGSRGSGSDASSDNARRSRSAEASEHDDDSRESGLPSFASQNDAQNNGSRREVSAAGAASNIAPVAVHAAQG